MWIHLVAMLHRVAVKGDKAVVVANKTVNEIILNQHIVLSESLGLSTLLRVMLA